MPLLVKWPRGMDADPEVRQTVALSALVPTLLQAAGADLPAAGAPPLPRRDGGPGEEVYAEGLLYGEEQTALVTDRYKVIYHPFARRPEEQFEVYDLRHDPEERRNLAGDERTGHLQVRLRERSEWAEAAADRWQSKLAAGPSRPGLSAEEQCSLRALGYVGE